MSWKQRFDSDGFCTIPDFLSSEQVDELLTHAQHWINQFDPEKEGLSAFSTGEDQKRDEYFLESGDKIRYFLETDAIKDGKLVCEPRRSINKIGHFLHELDPAFKKHSINAKTQEISKTLGFVDPRILQSMLIFKQPEIGGEVPGHIDSTFLYTNPLSAVGFWIALEDCTLENGCMWFAPGSHKQYQIRQRFIRSNGSTAFIKLSDAQEPPSDAYVAVPVKKGTLVLIHGSVYHKSGPNRSSKSRWIYTFHCIEGQNEYPADNWLQTKAPFTKLF